MSRTATSSTEVLREQRRELRRQLNEQNEETRRLRVAMAEDASPVIPPQLARSINAEDRIRSAMEDIDQQLAELGHVSGGGGADASGLLGDRLSDPAVMSELRKIAFTSQRVDWTLGEVPVETAMGWTGSRLQAPGPVAPTPGMVQSGTARILPPPVAPADFLDLVPSTNLDVPGSFPYAREVASAGPGPAPTAPLAVKPQIGFNYEDAEAVPATIAGWIKIARQTPSDAPMLARQIQTRLPQRVRLAVQTETLSGDGTVSDRTGKPGIVGLLNTTGVAAETVDAGGLVPDAIIEAIVDVLMVGSRPNVCALNPRDWATLMTTKAAGSGEYVASPFLATAQQIWGTTLVPAVGVPQGRILVGDTTSLTLLWREPPVIRISDNDEDDATRNRLTIICECRVALAVWQPSSWCVVDLTA